MTVAMPCWSMSFIVNTCTFGVANPLLLEVVEIADADEHRLFRRGLSGERAPIFDNSAGSGPSSAASGMPCTLPLVVVARRVHVAVRVDPEQADLAALGRREVGRRADRSGRQRVVAAQHDRQRAVLVRLVDLLIELLAHARDLPDVFLLRIAFRLRLRDGRRRSPLSMTTQPMPASRSPMPAIRTADGPMSTPRRPPPRSSGHAKNVNRSGFHVPD